MGVLIYLLSRFNLPECMNTIDFSSTSPQTVPRRFKFGPMTPETRRSNVAICILLWSVIAYLFISHFVMMRVEIKGASMWPTLLDGQRYMLYRAPYLFRAPHQGEIVVIRDPQDHDLSIKRVIGLPGETFEIRRDGVYINGAKLPEPYLTKYSAIASGQQTHQAHRARTPSILRHGR